MIYHFEYKNFSLFKKYLEILTAKYPKEMPTVRLVFSKKPDLKAYRYLKRKGLNIEFCCEINHLSLSAILYARKRKINLYLTCTKTPTKLAVKKLKKLKVLTPVAVSDERFLPYIKNEFLLIKSTNLNTPFTADLFNLCALGKTLYTCDFSSCLGKNLCVDFNGQVYFCPSDKNSSLLGNILDENDFFDCEKFTEILTKQIEKRECCKSSCNFYPACKGGCALKFDCEKFKVEFLSAKSTYSKIISNGENLLNIPRYQAESVLLSASNGNIFLKKNQTDE